jgi:D-amino-acid oxidase
MREGVELWREPVPDPWWATAVPSVRRCTDDELPPGYHDGHTFVAPVIEMPVYLGYLLGRFSGAGGCIEQRALSSLEEAGESRVVVNCAGLGARRLVGDPTMVPIRGQIVRVSNPGLERFTLDEGNPEDVTHGVPRVHNYGHGGSGVTLSWGCAEETLRLVSQILSEGE